MVIRVIRLLGLHGLLGLLGLCRVMVRLEQVGDTWCVCVIVLYVCAYVIVCVRDSVVCVCVCDSVCDSVTVHFEQQVRVTALPLHNKVPKVPVRE